MWLLPVLLPPTTASGPGLAIGSVGLHARWEADTLNAAADTSAVSSWADQISSITLAQATGTAQPTLRKSIVNGKSVVRFDGSDFLAATLSNGRAASWTRSIVAKVPNLGAAPMHITGGDRNFPEGIYIRRGGYGNATKIEAGVSATNTFAVSSGTLDDNFHVITFSWDHTTQTGTIYLDGTQIGSGVNADGIDRASSVLIVGGDGTTGASDPMIGDIAAIFQKNAVMTDAERAGVHTYVQTTYAITVADYNPPATTTLVNRVYVVIGGVEVAYQPRVVVGGVEVPATIEVV